MSEKKFCGNGKTWGQYGNIKLGIRVADLIVSETGWANIIIAQKKDKPDEWYAYNDEWKPQGGRTGSKPYVSKADEWNPF